MTKSMATKTDDKMVSASMKLSQIASALNADVIGGDVTITGFAIDSRKVKPGDLFVAIKTEQADGHDYINDAAEKGAVAALVSNCVESTLPRIMVPDTIKALGQWASSWSSGFMAPIIAITGSCGKTTVKEMVAAIMQQNVSGKPSKVLATQGNLNNHLGVPLTLLRLNEEHGAAVIEMGANHQGEIGYLTKMTQPDVAILNNAAPVHIEGFGSLEGVAKGKGEIFTGLVPNGTAIINADDSFAKYWQELVAQLPVKVKTFAVKNPADVMARNIEETDTGVQFELVSGGESLKIELPLVGEHNVMNALAAAAATLATGKTLLDIKLGLEGMAAVPGRLQRKQGINGSLVIDDTYNANPAALKAAIEVLCHYSGQKIVVVGDMAELGEDAAKIHYQSGVEAAATNIDVVAGVGPLTKELVEGFKAQAADKSAVHFENKSTLIEWLIPRIDSDTKILIKGSRSMRMEEVVNSLLEAEVSA